MKILKLKDKDKQAFNELAFSYGTVFNSIEWADIFSNNIQYYGFYNDNNILIGGFILYRENKFGFSIYRNPPCTPAIGPFLKIDAQSATTIMDTWKELLTLFADFVDELSYSVISLSLNVNITDTQPFIWKKFKVVPNYTYLIDLKLSLEDLWKKLSKVRKNEIKKTESDGLVVRQNYDYEIIKKLVLKTFSRQKKEIDDHYLDKILFEFANKDNSYAFVTYKGTVPIAGTLCIYHKNIAHALIGGYDNEQKHRGAGPLADWECIKYAKNLGIPNFDFEGSMIPPVEKYIRGFGGILTPYYTINKAKLLLEMALKLIRRERF